jgi:hypothetical protein
VGACFLNHLMLRYYQRFFRKVKDLMFAHEYPRAPAQGSNRRYTGRVRGESFDLV